MLLIGHIEIKMKYNPNLHEEVNARYEREAREKDRARKDSKDEPKQDTPPAFELDDKKFIYVPEINLHVSKERVSNGKSWHDTHDEFKNQGVRMPTINEFRAYLKHLRDNPSEEYTKIFNEITEVRIPWRANWLDAYFQEENNQMYILTHNKFKKELLKDYLTEDKTPGINLDSWLNDSNSQGLPKPRIKKGDLYYWSPRDERVVRFDAYSDGAGLVCDWGLGYSNPSLGAYACAGGTLSRLI
jgi:hypothetical protein